MTRTISIPAEPESGEEPRVSVDLTLRDWAMLEVALVEFVWMVESNECAALTGWERGDFERLEQRVLVERAR